MEVMDEIMDAFSFEVPIRGRKVDTNVLVCSNFQSPVYIETRFTMWIKILYLLTFVWVVKVLFHVSCVTEVLARHVEHVQEEMEIGLSCVGL